jgi:glycosyltransferase involved in cell wall biosynthesis
MIGATDSHVGREGSRSTLLSVVIPTRNRAHYAKASIRTTLLSSSDRLEVVVQDNSDGDELAQYIKDNMSDPRLRYWHDCEQLDVIENFSRGLQRSCGQFVAFIGDDDGVNPEIVEAALWAEREEVDAIISTRPAQYWWPGTRYRYHGESFSASMTIRSFDCTVTYPNPEAELARCARQAGQTIGDLPSPYYGIIRRTCLDKVREASGRFFPGPSPDLAGAVAVATFTRRMAKVDYPLFIPGVSRASTAGLGAQKRHIGRLEDQEHLPRWAIENWSRLVPRFFSGETIWAEDVVQALRATGREDVLASFNTSRLHAMCAVFHPRFLSTILRSLRIASAERSKPLSLALTEFAFWYGLTWARRARFLVHNRLIRPLSIGVSTLQGIQSIEQAAEALEAYLSAHRLTVHRALGASDKGK